MSDETTSQPGQQSAQAQAQEAYNQAWQSAAQTQKIPGAGEQAQETKDKDKDEAATREALDDLKAALAQLATAATKLGHLAQVKVREEWKTTKPELQKTIEEMKRGLESAATRASSTLDNLAKKVDKPGAGQTTPETPADGQPRQPEQPEQQTPPSV